MLKAGNFDTDSYCETRGQVFNTAACSLLSFIVSCHVFNMINYLFIITHCAVSSTWYTFSDTFLVLSIDQLLKQGIYIKKIISNVIKH